MTAADAGASPAGAEVELCAFRVGGEDYAVDVMRVREVLPPPPVTPVPRAPPFVEGVVHLRGEVIPVVDVRERFGLPIIPPTRRTRLLVVKVADRHLGLVVDEVREVLRLPRCALRPAPLLGSTGPRFFVGACGGDAPAGGGPVRLLLDVRALLEPVSPGEREAVRAQARAARGA